MHFHVYLNEKISPFLARNSNDIVSKFEQRYSFQVLRMTAKCVRNVNTMLQDLDTRYQISNASYFPQSPLLV